MAALCTPCICAQPERARGERGEPERCLGVRRSQDFFNHVLEQHARLYPGNELDTPPPSLVTGVPTTENCAHGEGRRMMYFHGTDDFVCPYEGTGPEWYDPPREETARRWARHNRCANEDPEIEQVSELAQRWVWSGCTAPTEYYKIEDFGHTWPGCAQPRLLPRLFQGRFLLLLRRRQLAQKQRRGCAEGRCQCVQVAWGEPLWDRGE